MKRKFEIGAVNYESAYFTDMNLIFSLNRYLNNLTGKKFKFKSGKIFLLKHEDYSLLTDRQNEINGFKLILNLRKWNNAYGGYNCIIENDKEFFRTQGLPNCLSIIKTNSRMKSFVKYVNNLSGKNKRYFIELIFFQV